MRMKPGNPPTKEELEAVRQKLIEQIEEVQQLFGAGQNGHELLTSKAALKSIEQLIRREKRQKRDVA
jgi:exopolyphosphatase/pppGpp-phosphohydrolase